MKSTFIIKFYRTTLAVVGLLLVAFQGVAQYGYALNFTQASSQYVSVPHSSSINLGTTFTMEAIVNYTGNNATIIDKGNYDFLWQLNANNNGSKMGFYTGATSTWTYSTAPVLQGVPTHVAIVGTGGTVTFYINGVASGSGTGLSQQDNLPMTIGRQQPSSCQCNHMNGSMDELRIWNIVRTPAQIAGSMSSSVPANSTGLVAYYKFDEGGGTTTADASGNGNNGTLVNGPTWAGSVSGTQTGGGSVGIGTSTPSANAALDITSTSKGLMLPRLSDTSAVANPTAGLIIYNNNTKAPAYYDGNVWQDLLNVAISNAPNPNADSVVYKLDSHVLPSGTAIFKVESIEMSATNGQTVPTATIAIPMHLNSIPLQKQFLLDAAFGDVMEVFVYKRGATTASYSYKFRNPKVVANSFVHATNIVTGSVAYTITYDKVGFKDVANNISFGWSYVAPIGLTTY